MAKTITFTLDRQPVSPPNQLFRVKHDPEIYAEKFVYPGHGQYYHEEGWNWRAGYPEVYYLLGTHSVPFDEKWQKLSYAMNPAIQPLKWREVYDDWRAFMNKTGFSHVAPSDPAYVPKKDYINYRDINATLLPAWDKIRVCGGATISGRRDGSTVIVDTLKYDSPPSLEWLMERPWFYFHAVSILEINKLPVIDKFPQNGSHPTLVPLVAINEVRIPYGAVEAVDSVVDPYRIY